jgi:hypothetical protein
VIDRLEQAGYVRRVPDPTDRRRVIVELVPERMSAVEATMARVTDKSASEIGHYSEAELAVINDFLGRMAAITHAEATALRYELDDDAAPVGGIGDAPDVAGLLEPVDHAGDRTGGQAREVGQPPGGRRARIDEDLEGLDVRLGQAEPDGHGLPEQGALEVDVPQGAQHGVDGFAVHA